jgi:hypothetical protein
MLAMRSGGGNHGDVPLFSIEVVVSCTICVYIYIPYIITTISENNSE